MATCTAMATETASKWEFLIVWYNYDWSSFFLANKQTQKNDKK